MKLLRLFKSSSTYFLQNPATLAENRKRVYTYLFWKGYSEEEIRIYQHAYDYFVNNPTHFDGATMTEDLFDIDSLELAAMLHDFMYIQFAASGSFKYTWLADKLMRTEMRRMNKSTWNTGVRFVLLILKSPFFVPYTYIFKNRRMTDFDRDIFEEVFKTLFKRSPHPWYKEFEGEMRWTLFFTLLIIGYIWRVSLADFFLSLKWILF